MRIVVIPLDEECADVAFEHARELCDHPTSEIVAFRPYRRPFWWNLSGLSGTPLACLSDEDLHRSEEAELAQLCSDRDVDRVCARGRAAPALATHPKLRDCDAIVIGATGRSRRRASRLATELSAWDDVEVVGVPVAAPLTS